LTDYDWVVRGELRFEIRGMGASPMFLKKHGRGARATRRTKASIKSFGLL
jgi:hypothetical protein